MSSSGIYVDSFEAPRQCTMEYNHDCYDEECTFDGMVEVFFDPEVYAQWWTCPLCNAEHDEGMEGDCDDFV